MCPSGCFDGTIAPKQSPFWDVPFEGGVLKFYRHQLIAGEVQEGLVKGFEKRAPTKAPKSRLRKSLPDKSKLLVD